MRKLKLGIDTLQVQSFHTAPVTRGRGTVHGRQADTVNGAQFADTVVVDDARTYPDCPSPLCVDTPLASCDGTCGAPGC
jgi:hypothetical protein